MSGAAPSYDDLLELTRHQARLIQDLEAKVNWLQAEADRLKAELEAARREGKRQAAPSPRGRPNPTPRGRGASPDMPRATARLRRRSRWTRTFEVPRPERCPGCQAPLEDVSVAVHDQYQIDLPEPKPVITRFRVPVTHCPLCRRRVQGRHPDQISDAIGAAAVKYDPRLLGFAADLKHRLGVPYRKCAAALGTLCGLTIGPSALVRSGHRLRRLARPSYDRLIEAARCSPVQHADETGWKIGGHPAWLWVFADRHSTIHLIRRSRGHEVVEEILGADYRGVLVSDCFPAYAPLPYLKGQCAAQLLRRCSELARSKVRGAVRFPRRVASLVRQALALERRRGRIGDHGYDVDS